MGTRVPFPSSIDLCLTHIRGSRWQFSIISTIGKVVADRYIGSRKVMSTSTNIHFALRDPPQKNSKGFKRGVRHTPRARRLQNNRANLLTLVECWRPSSNVQMESAEANASFGVPLVRSPRCSRVCDVHVSPVRRRQKYSAHQHDQTRSAAPPRPAHPRLGPVHRRISSFERCTLLRWGWIWASLFFPCGSKRAECLLLHESDEIRQHAPTITLIRDPKVPRMPAPAPIDARTANVLLVDGCTWPRTRRVASFCFGDRTTVVHIPHVGMQSTGDQADLVSAVDVRGGSNWRLLHSHERIVDALLASDLKRVPVHAAHRVRRCSLGVRRPCASTRYARVPFLAPLWSVVPGRGATIYDFSVSLHIVERRRPYGSAQRHNALSFAPRRSLESCSECSRADAVSSS